MARPTSIFLVDEQPIVLDALAGRLGREEEFEVIGTATHSDKAFFAIFEYQPDLVVMDMELPGRGAIDVADQIASRLPRTRTVLYTGYETDVFIDMALRLGVAGYLLKTEPVHDVIAALRRIRDGETVFSQPILHRVQFDREADEFVVKSQNFLSGLSLRQIQVLRHLARGESVKEVARTMMLSERAVESHKYRIMRKIGIHDRVLLTRFAIREGLLPA